ncbi:unnamed protein product, partial [Darwinula stevensoni]
DGIHSQTKWVSAYSFLWQEGMRIPYTLTVIDTPGLGDTEGLQRDEELVVKMKEFLELCAPDMDFINAVGFVLQASLCRLTATQKYIFHAISQLFGIDTKEKFVLLISFSDGQEAPVIQTVEGAGFSYNKHYYFNNSALFASNNWELQKMFWDLGLKSNEMFLNSLGKTAPVGLAQTKIVLAKRQDLNETLKELQKKIPEVSSKIIHLEDKCSLLKNNLSTEVQKIPLEKENAINCSKCKHTTCEYPATISKVTNVKESKCMKSEEKSFHCKKCGCSWRYHRLEPKRYEMKATPKRKRRKDPVKDDEERRQRRDLQRLIIEIQKNQVELLSLIQQAHQATNELRKIALNPDPMPMEEYINFLVDLEKKEHKEGFSMRIQQLEQVKQACDVCKKMLEEENISADFPDVMHIVEKQGIDFESLTNDSTDTESEDEAPRNIVDTFKMHDGLIVNLVNAHCGSRVHVVKMGLNGEMRKDSKKFKGVNQFELGSCSWVQAPDMKNASYATSVVILDICFHIIGGSRKHERLGTKSKTRGELSPCSGGKKRP